MNRAVVFGCLLLAGAFLLAGCQQESPAEPAPVASSAGAAGHAQDVARGRYLLRIGDCASCHTQARGKRWAGGRAIPTPYGTVYSTNLTPDRKTGIGSWNADDFWDALHHGRRPDGKALYPAFPYPSFTRIRRADSDAMFAALRELPAVRQPDRKPELSFPYSQRWLLPVWRALYFQPGVYQDNPNKSEQWNRGAYLVAGAGHCTACHSPRGFLGGSKKGSALVGGMIPVQGWYAPDLHANHGGGLEDWTRQDVARFLKTGRSGHGTAFGPMSEVIAASLQYLTDADADAIATFLLDQPPQQAPEPARSRRVSDQQAAGLVQQGKKIYQHQCADCHGDDGTGHGDIYPPLAGNTSLRRRPVNTIRMVLLGGFGPSTRAYPRPYSMPPFAPRLSDAEVAAVVTYIRREFGQTEDVVTAHQVNQHRSAPRR